MAANDQIPDSDSTEDELAQDFGKNAAIGEASPSAPTMSPLSHRFRKSSSKSIDRTKGRSSADAPIAVMVSGPARPWEYQPFNGDTTVDSVLEKIESHDGEDWYRIDYETGKTESVSLFTLRNSTTRL